MKKLILLLNFISHIVYSQTYSVVEKQIEVTSHVYNSFILEMSSGNTILIQMEPKIEGFLLKTYDNKHDERVSTKIKLEKVKDINDVYVVDFKELNQTPTLFYIIFTNGIANFYKATINQYTGETTSEKLHSYKQTDAVMYFYQKNCFYKIIENKKQTKYCIITGTTSDNKQYEFNVNTYNTNSNQVISKQSKIINDCFQLELLDAIMDDNSVYLCLNKKFKPKESETQGWFTITEVTYIPENIVSVLQIDIESKKEEEIKLVFLDKIVYSSKAQFNFDVKNNQINLLLSQINPKDKYGKLPDVKNLFMKFSKLKFEMLYKKEITNSLAINKIATMYPEIKIDKSTFVNFPQYFITDPEGNNTFVFQTVFNSFNKPDGGSSFTQQEFAFEYANENAEIYSMQFSTYKHTINGCLGGSLDEFSFHCNAYTKSHSPRFFSADDDYYHFKILDIGDKMATILNLHPKNIEKNLSEKLIGNTEKDIMTPMILCTNKNYYSFEKVFNDSEKYGKLRFNVNVSSYNPKNKIYSVLATELGGKKERLVWIKFD